MKILNSKKFFFTALSILSIIGYGVFVFAAAPNGGYAPGSTLDPDCAPGDNDCIVTILNGGSQWDDVLGGINYAGGNVGIGTVTPTEALDVVGTIQGSNLNITGSETTISAPTNISASFIYDNSYNYGAYNLPHNYRVYSYKDTGQGRIYSSSYLTLSPPVGSAPAAPTNLSANQTCADGCNYMANGSGVYNFRVYSYKIINNQRIYSTSYAALGFDFVDDNSFNNYDVTVSWDPVTGADGYRVLKYDPGYNGYNYDAGYDTTDTSIVDDGCGNVCYESNKSSVVNTSDIYDDNSGNSYGIELSWDPVVGADGYRVLKYDPAYNGYNYDAGYDTTVTSIIDDGCGSVCFESNLTWVGQTSAYTNVATINGQLTLTGPIVLNSTTLAVTGSSLGWNTDISGLTGSNNVFFGANAGNGATYANNSNFFGENAGQNATDAFSSNFLGYQAGQGATGAYYSNFFGNNAGQNATYAQNSNFLGYQAGSGATGAYNSNFFGQNAGQNATNAYRSNFFGEHAGNGATSAYSSNFFGENAGQNATYASNSNFFGYLAGNSATSASNSNFFGQNAGNGATSAYYSNFLGYQAGQDATSAYNSNFFGQNAGNGATSAYYSNFLGYQAGQSATGASNSNFFGVNAGLGATSAYYSNFFGVSAGQGATGANYSNFFGQNAGLGATSAYRSNFFGQNTGNGATSAYNSNFFGVNAGQGATGANNSNFFGEYAGNGATSAYNSNFFGVNAGQGATGANNSNFLGYQAGSDATSAYSSNFFGENAGTGATGAHLGNFFGKLAGYQATDARVSNFIGYGSGYLSTNAQQSNFLGWSAGGEAANASFANFMGREAGFSADNASGSNFLGPYAGRFADNANNSNFFGDRAGHAATNAARSNFFGVNAGQNATNASNSIFIGQSAGNGDTVDNTVDPDNFSILIGQSTSTGGYSNSIALGGYATNTASNQLMIGSTSRPINTLVLTGASGNTCTLDVTVASPSCSSDERLKTNVEDLTNDTLDKLVQVKTVSYTWNNFPDKGAQIGFLAQDLEQYFPSLVSDAPNGFKTVSYGGMTPVLVQAIREMNLHITELSNMERPNTWRDSLIAWFGNVENGIQRLFVKEVHTDTLCVGQTCLNETQVQQILQTIGSQGVIPINNSQGNSDGNTAEDNPVNSNEGTADTTNGGSTETGASSPDVQNSDNTVDTSSGDGTVSPDSNTVTTPDTESIE